MVLEKKSIHNKLMNYIKDIKSRYKKGNIVERIIYINSIIFIFTLFISVIQELYKIEINGILKWFALDHNFSILLSKPWTIISYGFLHADFIHLLLNLITLNFIGNLFIEYFNGSLSCNLLDFKYFSYGFKIVLPLLNNIDRPHFTCSEYPLIKIGTNNFRPQKILGKTILFTLNPVTGDDQ